MARACSICSRPDAGTINALLADGRSARSVAAEVGASEDAVQRHAQRHLAGRRSVPPPTPAREPDPDAPAQADPDPLDELVEALREQALAGNPAIAHQYRLALAAQMDLRHAAPPQRDLATEPEWIELRTRLMAALAPFPEARAAVVADLEGMA